MKILSYDEMLSLPEAQGFAKRDNSRLLADYLVRRLCNKKLSDFSISENFKIEAPIATLIVDENGAKLESKHKSTENLLRLFSKINATQDKLKQLSNKLKNANSPSAINAAKSLTTSTIELAKDGLKLTDEATYNERLETCKICENWNDKLNFGRCKVGNLNSARLRILRTKCPLGKW